MKILYKQPFDAINGCCDVSLSSTDCFNYILKIQFKDKKTGEKKQVLLTFEECAGMRHTLSDYLIVSDYNNYEQLIEVENSPWIKQFYAGLEKHKAYNTWYEIASKLKHYSIFFHDHGHFEFLAENCIIEQSQ